MIFADSSAIAKLYVDEAGSSHMRKFAVLLVSALCRVETTSAIWRKARSGEINESEAEQLVRDFRADLRSKRTDGPELIALPVSTKLLNSAARLVTIHDLRSLDAVQLATALAAREVDPQCDAFACYDERLARVAALHGFTIHSPS